MKAKSLLYALCFLSVCGVSYSCSDDYDLDETLPEDMGNGGIYDQLRDRGFSTTVRLIDDLGYSEVLSKTGSKTLFVADDAAWARFFANTTWTDGAGNPVRSYDQLSVGQKKVLFKNAMLDNAYVLEMLANVTLNSTLSKKQCLRQVTAFDAVDTIPYWLPAELPVMHNAIDAETETAYTSDLAWWNNKDFWGRRNQPGSRMTYMAVDGTRGMMTHFIEANMKEKNITHSDASFIISGDRTAWPEEVNRSYIYNRQIVQQDIVCKNGYIHVLDDVLVPPSNMAETIRQTPEVSYFSAMLDRFSAPYYDATLTANYRALHDIGTDSVFVKLYMAETGRRGNISIDPDESTLSGEFPRLPYDPGWNEYAVSSTIAKEQDMGAMFVPSNEAMWTYFTEGQGVTLMDRFATELPVTRENFLDNLYQIPLNIMRSLINNLMKTSFVETVPSKWKTIMNDAQDQMFPPIDYPGDSYYDLFDKVLMANNGVVYVMNKLIAPADFASVIAPALYSENAQVMNALLTADENAGVEDANSFTNSPLQKYYSIYLKAMQSHFTLFIPCDEGLRDYGIVDPFAYSVGNSAAQRRNWRFWSFEYQKTNVKGKYVPIQMRAYTWNPDNARHKDNTTALGGFSIIRNSQATNDNAGGELRAYLLTEMVDQHIIVHDDDQADGVLSTPNWYLSREGAPVYVNHKVAANNSEGMEVCGGLQLWLNSDENAANDEVCTVLKGFDQTGKVTGYGNGMSYMLDRPMQPTIHSVYHMLNGKEDYSAFFGLCDYNGLNTLLEDIGFNYVKRDSTMATADWNRERRKYFIFRELDATNNYFTPNNEKLVRFFNNYNYTIYLPTNDAVQQALDNGLPTWEQIKNYGDEIKMLTDQINMIDEEDETRAEEREALIDQRWEQMQKAQAMTTCLLNFLKFHFQDQSLFVDNVDGTKSGSYQTSCVDSETNNYLMLNVSRSTGDIAVTDNVGNVVHVNTSSPTNYNVLANDIQYSKRNNTATSGNLGHVKVNSYVVMHELSGGKFLNFLSRAEWQRSGGRFDSAWATADAARRFVHKYRIRK
ncbi:MAG: hypothetical protein J6M53_00635 [Bacteroidaceae bacterium]|nr:hypothetical protein [Bacteroidaceae bacterium]